MTPERWKQIDELAQSALEREGDKRASFLYEACGGDDELRGEVESQIAYQQQASKFLEEPAFKHAAELIAVSQTEIETMEGRTISHYSILRKLGAGGMGEVYLAQDTTLNRKVAIKFLSQNLVAGEQARKRLVREARAAAALDHPHICAVHEVGEDAGYSFIVMQYVEGETLSSRMQRQPVEFREALDIALKIADALAEAHAHGIIHRDVKPQNVMLTASGQVKVLDFGLARVIRDVSSIDSIGETESLVTTPGTVIGTVPYMSPEQVRGEPLDARSDIFSLGVVFYEMLTRMNPFQAETMGATMSAILTKDPPPLARHLSRAPDTLQRIVGKALSKDTGDRYQSLKEMLIDLREIGRGWQFEAMRRRSTGPGIRDLAEGDSTVGPAKEETGSKQAAGNGGSFEATKTSRVRVVIGGIMGRKVSLFFTLTVIVLASAAAYFYFHHQPVLTEQDTILIADFVNTTGDEEFDLALKQGLAVQLEQSPFLNIFSDERTIRVLAFMGRSPDSPITRDVALEICERQGLKAMLLGRIASLGSHYVITLEADNAQTGDVLAREQQEAENKEQVLSVLRKTATHLREKLGESMSTIRRFDPPMEGTTSSLAALRAFSAGRTLHLKGQEREAIPLLKQAVDIDPNFALGYGVLAVTYLNAGENIVGREYAVKAFDLREQASEREKLWITAIFYLFFSEDVDKAIEAVGLLKQFKPRDSSTRNLLGALYGRLGQNEKAVEEYQQAIKLDPTWAVPYGTLAAQLILLGRFADATEILDQASTRKLEPLFSHYSRYVLAFIHADSAAMKEQIDWASHGSNGSRAFYWQAMASAFTGQLRQSRAFSNRASGAAERRGSKEAAAGFATWKAVTDAVFGNCERAKEATAKGLSLAHTGDSVWNATMALAVCSKAGKAAFLGDEYEKRFSKDPMSNAIGLAALQAAVELSRNNAARAIDLLEGANQYESIAAFWPECVRGQAYLKLGKPADAAAQFQKILDHRGWDPISYLYPIAHLGLARAALLQRDTTKARKSYQELFALWKDADDDLPILIEAKKEYAALK